MGQLQAEHAAETQLMAEAHSTQISQLRNANQQSAAEETARLEAQHKTYVATLQEAMEDRVRTLQLQLETEHVAGQTAKDGYKREACPWRVKGLSAGEGRVPQAAPPRPAHSGTRTPPPASSAYHTPSPPHMRATA